MALPIAGRLLVSADGVCSVHPITARHHRWSALADAPEEAHAENVGVYLLLKMVAIYDIGGGTFAIAVSRILLYVDTWDGDILHCGKLVFLLE